MSGITHFWRDSSRILPVLATLVAASALTPVRAQMISETVNVRHDPEKLGQQVLGVIDRAIAHRASYVKPSQVKAS